MKKLIYILLSLVLVSTGCVGELGSDDIRVDEGFVLTINSSPLTKTVTNPGAAYERQLNTLDCFFYPKGQTGSPCVFYHRQTFAADATGQVKFAIDVVEDAIRKIFPTESTCEIFVIANLPSDVIPEGVEFNSDPTNIHTKLESLESYLLQMKGRQSSEYESDYDDIDQPFVMAGRAIGQKDSKKNASATISLRRAASKITFSVAIPAYLDVKDKDNNTVRMIPQLTDDADNVTLKAAFHNGTSKGYLYKGADATTQNALFNTEKCRFEYSGTTLPVVKSKVNTQVDSIPERRVYNCEVPFYTYARAWEKGSADAAYIAFEMPWGYDKQGEGMKYATYYYQILVNGAGRKFEPNNWYDMFVNIGVIGSAVENIPIVIDHQIFYVLDWTDEISGYEHPDEDVYLEVYTYFIVNQKFIEIDNENYCNIKYNASHNIAWQVTDAYYYNNSGVTSTQQNIDKATITFDNSQKGQLTLLHNIPSSVYSPIYINLNMWLDIDGDGVLDANESADYLEQVSIIQYPPMYVIRDESTLRSIYVNGTRNYNSVRLTNTYLFTENQTNYYPLGYNDGVRNFDRNNDIGKDNDEINYSMFIINVSSFDKDDTFQAPALNSDGCPIVGEGTGPGTNNAPKPQPTPQSYNYIIGDPRKRVSDVNLDGAANHNVPNRWATANALYPVDGSTNRKLKYYYPTEDFGNSFQIIAPKFRVVSFNNASGKECTAVSAAMRCASLQEDGFPAGRWRLPTIAEVQYIIYLQGQGAIQEIFSSSSSAYATASYANADKSRRITLSLDGKNLVWNNLSNQISVRCVYDDWYWGSDRQALENDAAGKNTPGGFYRFTWGDKEITWN